MCGIAGYVSVPGADQSQLKLIAAILGIEMQARGSQSFGTLDTQGNIFKGLGSIGSNFVLPLVMPESYAIHTRFATHGDITLANQHPFTQGAITGIHNGVIGNHEELNAKYGRNFAVDSQHIFQHINDGLTDLEDIQGYGAIVYLRDGKFYAGTFNRGSLEIANTALGKIFASTSEAVKKACRFAGVEIENWDRLNDNVIYELAPTSGFIAFETKAFGTTRKWDDAADGKWWLSMSKKNDASISNSLASRIAAEILGEGGVEVETHEHDESTTGLECAHCYGECLPERHYINADGQIVCADCARTSYAFVAEDEYEITPDKGWDLSCALCKDEKIDPIVTLIEEDGVICESCFACNWNTKGLTKVTSTLVH